MEIQCTFKFKYQDQCKESDKLSQNQGPDKTLTIISVSKTYGDDLYKQFETALAIIPILIISYHKNCIKIYIIIKLEKISSM